MKNTAALWLALFGIFVSAAGRAEIKSIRYTGAEDGAADLAHVLQVVKSKTGISLAESDFILVEERDLARYHFRMVAQTAAGIPIRGAVIRTWTSRKTGRAVQVEAHVSTPLPAHRSFIDDDRGALSSEATLSAARRVIARHADDREIRGVNWNDEWQGETLVRVVRVRGRRGNHVLHFGIPSGRLIRHEYREFPTYDVTPGEMSLPVDVYPIYEEVEGEGTLLERKPSQLRYLKTHVARPKEDPYTPLKQKRYFYSKLHPVLGLTEGGQAQGFWAMSVLRAEASKLFGALEVSPNDFRGGVVLEGRYATISLHPNARDKFEGLEFVPQLSGHFRPDWREVAEIPGEWEVVPGTGHRGRPLMSPGESLERPARRLPDHDPVKYLNDGFDEMQVYWAVNQMFDSLRPMGFTDPELSSRPFHAFLYDPDIAYRDNAYYTDDTINFTTYSAKQPNMARDNTTIWHELGHGVMDRLMGDHIVLADTGGLSEGMADFVAQLVLNDVTTEAFPGKDKMRILNNTGFYLTNEVHDDGEAYGGSLNDLLEAAMEAHGKAGLVKVSDLTLDAMRLARNHPGLSAVDWFERMLFADEMGNPPVREPGELRGLILRSLGGRNFNLDGSPAARFVMKNGDAEVSSTGPGSRPNPIPVRLAPAATASYRLNVSLEGTPTYAFRYPVTIRVGLRGGPLQGGIHWVGEEKEAFEQTLESESDRASFDLTVTGTCDEVNRPDNSCVDFAYVQVLNDGDTKPVAKKRFYLRVYPTVR